VSAHPDSRLPGPGKNPLRLTQRSRFKRWAGIGAVLADERDKVVVERPAPGVGASAANLQPGDQIVAVEGRSTLGASAKAVAAQIRGEEGTRATLTIIRKGSRRTEVVEITRRALRWGEVAPVALTPPSPSSIGVASPSPFVQSGRPADLAALVGSPAPPISIDTWVNYPPTLGDTLEGRLLLIDFWATWCGPCRRTLPDLAALAREYDGKGLTVVGVSIDDNPSAVADFLEEQPLPYAIGWSPHDQLPTPFVEAVPTMVLVGPDGTIRLQQRGGSVPLAEIRAEVARQLLAEP
jgi:thiol-disulfide isomerase/thioredoxin